MLARIFTRLFWAAIFFALGVWAAPSMGGLSRWIDTGLDGARAGFDVLWAWAETTVSTGPTTSKPAEPPAPVARTAPAAAPAAPPAPTPAPAPAPKPTPASAAAPAPAAPPVDPLDAARAANARGDIAGAIRTYEKLIAERPKDAALSGELGNVYWSAGRLKEAAKAYHAAAQTLIAAGRLDDAARLIDPIAKGDAGLAADLSRRLAAAGRS